MRIENHEYTVRASSVAPVRVLILLNSLAPYGAENFVLNHARFHDRARFRLVVAHLGGTRALADRFREIGVETIDLAAGGRRYTPLTMARLIRELRQRRIDVLQTHIGLAGVVGAVAGRIARVPALVITEQTTLRSHPAWLRRGNELTFRLAHSHVYISQAVAADFARRFPEAGAADVPIITNGIDVEGIAATALAARDVMRAELGIRPDEFAFGNVGRLADQKGQRYAITALAAVRARHPRAALWVVGSGDLHDSLIAEARSHGVDDAVHLLGQRMDVHRLLGAFDAYVHPALFEGLGIAVLEAMAAGLPVIASSVDAIPEYVHHEKTGLLVPPRDAHALASAMTRLLEDSAMAARLATDGRRLVARDHDIRASVQAYEALYERLIAA